MIFINRFEIYKNSYKTLISIYILLINFIIKERNRQVNIFPITSGPYRSQLSDIIRALVSLSPLNKGISITINREETNFCIFIINWLINLIGGNTIIKIKGIKAKYYYRFYYISKSKRGNLDYNILSNGYYYYQIIIIRKYINSLLIKLIRNDYNSK